MKHLCSCGEICEVDGEKDLKIATCKNCGKYYIYTHQLVNPTKEELLQEEIEHKVKALEKPRPAKRRTDV